MIYEDKELVEIACEVRIVTDKAYHVYDGSRVQWVPRSEIRNEVRDKQDVITSIWIPTWLALAKEFI